MANMSFIDKLNVLFNITKSSMTYLIVIIMLVILASILMTLNKKNSKKGVFYEIPIGVVFNNPLLSNLGPKIPVKFTLMGEVISNVETQITNYGINNALLQTNINIKLTEKVLLPISSKEINVEYNIPISLKMIQGAIPNYYFNGIESKSIVVPTK